MPHLLIDNTLLSIFVEKIREDNFGHALLPDGLSPAHFSDNCLACVCDVLLVVKYVLARFGSRLTILVDLLDDAHEPSLGLGLSIFVLGHGILKPLVLGQLAELAMRLGPPTSSPGKGDKLAFRTQKSISVSLPTISK